MDAYHTYTDKNELTGLLKEHTIARAEARPLASIARRAQTLFPDCSCSALLLDNGGG